MAPRWPEALRDGAFENFALFACFVNGKPAAAIVAINPVGAEFAIPGHDQATAANQDIPAPDELKTDIEALDTLVATIRKRRQG